jgi:predicted transcriptional regulator
MTDTLRALSDDKSLALFNMVAFSLPRDTGGVMTRLALTRKQFYSRMNRLIDEGLVTRKSDRYFLTSFGKVVYESHKLIGNAVENYWKLKAIDSIETLLSEDDLSVEEQRRIINALIERNDIKNIVLNQNVPSDKNHKLLAALPNNP